MTHLKLRPRMFFLRTKVVMKYQMTPPIRTGMLIRYSGHSPFEKSNRTGFTAKELAGSRSKVNTLVVASRISLVSAVVFSVTNKSLLLQIVVLPDILNLFSCILNMW